MQAKAHRAKITMEFDLSKAQAVAKQHNLSPKTIDVWKHRGEIPEIYFRQNPFQESKLLDYLQNPKLNAKAIFKKAGISYEKFKKAVKTDQYHVHLSKEDVQVLLGEIKTLKTSLSFIWMEFYRQTSFNLEEKLLIEETITQNPILVLPFLECTIDNIIYRRFLKRRAKNPAKKFEDFEAIYYLKMIAKLDQEL